MLSKMRKAQHSYLIKGILILIALSFVSFIFFYWGAGGKGTDKNPNIVAMVNGEIISKLEFKDAYKNALRFYEEKLKGEESRDFLKQLNIPRRVFDSLLEERLWFQEARKLKLGVSDEELRENISTLPYFQTNGKFDHSKYSYRLGVMGTAPAQFEASIRRQILVRKAKDIIKSSIIVNEREVEDEFIRKNLKLNIEYIKLDIDEFTRVAEVEDEKVEEYYSQNKENFRIPEGRKFQYFHIKSSNFVDQVNVGEDDIEEYFSKHGEKLNKTLDEAKDEIIETLTEEKSKEAARQFAENINNKISEGMELEKYAEEAGLSLETTDFLLRSDSIEGIPSPRIILNRAFSMQTGELSDPIKVKNDFYLVKLLEVKEPYIPPLSEVEDEVKEAISKELADEKALTAAREILDEARSKPGLKDVAGERGLSLEESGAFGVSGKNIPTLGSVGELKKIAFTLTPDSPYPSNPIKVKNSYVVFCLKEIIYPSRSEFNSGKDEIRETLTQQKEQELLNGWIEMLRDRSDIETNDEFLEQLG